MACRVIEQFRHLRIVSVKITPHFHATTPGLELISEGPGFAIYEETDRKTIKDTSRMLKAGAEKVFFARATDSSLYNAFGEVLRQVQEGTPLICESPALRQFADPGLLILMTSSMSDNQKDIKSLLKLPHVRFNVDYLLQNRDLPLVFNDGKWSSWHYGS